MRWGARSGSIRSLCEGFCFAFASRPEGCFRDFVADFSGDTQSHSTSQGLTLSPFPVPANVLSSVGTNFREIGTAPRKSFESFQVTSRRYHFGDDESGRSLRKLHRTRFHPEILRQTNCLQPSRIEDLGGDSSHCSAFEAARALP